MSVNVGERRPSPAGRAGGEAAERAGGGASVKDPPIDREQLKQKYRLEDLEIKAALGRLHFPR